MWISTRSRFSGAIVSGVTMKALTPSIVVFSILTFRRSVRPGRLRIVPAAPASETGFHSSPVFGRTFQPGRSGAAISFCTCGLTVSGTGSERVGTSKPPLLAGWAMAPGAKAATPATQIAPITARRSKDERSVIKLPPWPVAACCFRKARGSPASWAVLRPGLGSQTRKARRARLRP